MHTVYVYVHLLKHSIETFVLFLGIWIIGYFIIPLHYI